MWRDLIAVHPAAAMFPMMSHAELLELGRDILDNELRQPIVLWTPERAEDVSRSGPKENYLLDGRNRLEAVELVFADNDDRRELIEAMLCRQPTNPIGPVQLYSHDDPYAYVVSANVRRRHLNTEKKREVIEALLRESPERSDRATAAIAAVSDKTVAAVRAEAEANAEIPHKDERTEADGRKARGRRPGGARVVDGGASNDDMSQKWRRDMYFLWNSGTPADQEWFLETVADKPLADNIVSLRA